MPDTIKIRPAGGTWIVRAGGAIVGETFEPLELIEGDREPVIYVPRADMAMAFLEPSETRTTCPLKGEAQYFDIVVKSGTLKDAAWSYEDPHEPLAAIKDHLAFAPEHVTVERI